MVGRLKRLKRDPNKRGRGSGLYYHRGRGYYSKYSRKRDSMKLVGGDTSVGKGSYRHTHDWTNPNKILSDYGLIPESAFEMIKKQERGYEEEKYRLFKKSDFYDPMLEDKSLTRRERKTELKEKLRTGLF